MSLRKDIIIREKQNKQQQQKHVAWRALSKCATICHFEANWICILKTKGGPEYLTLTLAGFRFAVLNVQLGQNPASSGTSTWWNPNSNAIHAVFLSHGRQDQGKLQLLITTRATRTKATCLAKNETSHDPDISNHSLL